MSGGKYRITCHCTVCGNMWKTVVKDLSLPNPPCPNLACKAQPESRGMDFTSSRAPAAIGMSNMTKAIDETAQIVMEDHKLTDLRTDVRPTETMAPKLPAKQQQMADNFFGGGKRRGGGINTGALGRQALAGAFRGGSVDPVRPLHDARYRPPINVIASDSKN